MEGIITALITILGVFLANASIVAALFLWARSEARADARHAEIKLESTRELVRAMHEENRGLHVTLREFNNKKKGA